MKPANLKWNQPKMNPEVKKKWLAELRSGAYKQGKYQLRNENDEFCCLGVLCNIHAREHPELAKSETRAWSYMGETTFLPNAVANWANLKGYGGGLITINKSLEPISVHNDSGVSFEQIAKAVEEQL